MNYKPNKKKVMKNECRRHALFYNISPINFNFKLKKIMYFKLNERGLQSIQIAFPNSFSIKKKFKIDGTTSILI